MTSPFRRISLLFLLCLGCRRSDPNVVRFLVGPDIQGGWRAMVDRYNATGPARRIELVEGPNSTNMREQMYTIAFLSGRANYDLVYMDVIWLAKFAAQGWLLPLDDRFPAETRARFMPGDIAASTYEGKIYRVPVQADGGLLYYRTDLMPEPPKTFEDLVRLAKQHQDPPNRWGFVFQGRQYEGLVCFFLEVLWGHGADVLNERGEVTIDSPEAVRALQWVCDAVGTIAPEAVTTFDEEGARHEFEQGRAVFMRNWPYAWTIFQREDSPIRGKVGMVPMVHLAGHASAATLGGWGFAVARNARYPDDAWKFVEFVTRPEQLKLLHFKTGLIPSRRELFQDPEILKNNPHYERLYQVLLGVRPRTVHPKYARISNAISLYVSAALARRETPEAALEKAAERIREVLR